MIKYFNKKSILSSIGVLAFIFAFGVFTQTFAQDQYVIRQAQDAVREKIIRDKGGDVTFPNNSQAETYELSSSQTRVRGYGTWRRNYNSAAQNFSYEARVNTRNDKVDKIKYNFSSDNYEDGNGNVPSWAVGTFYGRNPQNGGRITLAINRNGNVVVTFDDGSTNYATIRGDRLTNNGVVSRITRTSNGISTTRIDNGERIDYSRSDNTDYDSDNNGGNVPSWAIGTFYGRNPQTGGNITLTINGNGSVVINFDGATSYASINGDRLNNNGIISRITRLNNGIRTTRTDNGERIDYYTNRNNNNNNNGGNVPNWAIGTFYARNPQTGGTITLTINRNGNVVIDFDGSVTYATVNGDRLFNNGIESKITRINNGIRTTRIDNGERIDYQRQ